EKILPLIREKVPQVEFRIVGSNPAQKVQELARIPKVVVTGHVPDVRDYVLDATVSVAPLRIARGTQNKILESMAMGIPVVATPQAAKGVQAVAGRDLMVAESPEEFAESVTELLRNTTLRGRLAQAGRNQVERTHLWHETLNILDATLSSGFALHK